MPCQVTPEGRGPAWATSLLEDNSQFGFGIYYGLKQRRGAYMAAARALLAGGRPGQHKAEGGTAGLAAGGRGGGGSTLTASADAAEVPFLLGACLADGGQPQRLLRGITTRPRNGKTTAAAISTDGSYLLARHCCVCMCIVCGMRQVSDNGLLCHQAALQLQPLVEVEGGCPAAPAPLAALWVEAGDMLEKPSCWIVVGSGLRGLGFEVFEPTACCGAGICCW